MRRLAILLGAVLAMTAGVAFLVKSPGTPGPPVATSASTGTPTLSSTASHSALTTLTTASPTTTVPPTTAARETTTGPSRTAARHRVSGTSGRAPAGSGRPRTSRRDGGSSRSTTTTTTTAAAGSHSGPNTPPPSGDRAFLTRMAGLANTVSTGRAALARRALLPVAAYQRVADVSDPEREWHDRLLADFNQDITALHAQLGNPGRATLGGVDVPTDEAEKMAAGTEGNRAPYWQVYDTTVSYAVNGAPLTFTVVTMISWRGQWYVEYLSSVH